VHTAGPIAPPAGQTWKLYYHANGKPIAMRVLLPGNSTGALYFLHSDHPSTALRTSLGSTSAVTDLSGSVIARQWYYPYGSVRASTGALPTDITFTGQRSDATGLYFYNARYYAPLSGRFISADTIVPEPKDLQSLNRYSFVRNNPIKYVDPSGHCWGIASGIRGLPTYGTTCANLDMAFTIISHPSEVLAQEDGARAYALAVAYTTGEVVAHGTLLIYGGALACGYASAACYQALTSGSGILGLACSDGDCSNEANAASATLDRASQAVNSGLEAIRQGAGRGYNSFEAFKYHEGPAGPGMAWHHIVEQNPANLARFGSLAIQNTNNLIRLPHGVGQLHQQISGYYSSIQPLVTGSNTLTVREWLATKSFEFQWRFGIDLIRRFGGDQFVIDQFGR
jgi:RHS repeat-associated protein